MTLFSKFTKTSSSEKAIYPWSHRKLSGSHAAIPRFGHGATTIDSQRFFVFGGLHKATMSANSIHVTGDTPSPRNFTAVEFIEGFVLLFGGEPIFSGENWDSQLYILCTNSNQWSKLRINGNSPRARSGHTMSAHNGHIYLWGGQYQGQYLNDMYTFNFKESKAEWLPIPYTNQAPSPRAGHVSAVYDDKLYIFGGVNANHLYDDIWYFDLITRVWNKVEALGYIPPPRESCAAALVNDTIYVFGGRGPNGTILGDLYAFRLKNQRWYTFQNMGAPPSARYGASFTLCQNKLYVFGGDSIHGKMDDGSYMYILDCSKIKYPPETSENERKGPQVTATALPEAKDMILLDTTNRTSLVTSPKPPQYHKHLDHFEDRVDTLSNSRSDLRQLSKEPIKPPRPPREGTAIVVPRMSIPNSEEKSKLLREILVRDTIISEMRKKEQWWRTEVSIVRHTYARSGRMSLNDEEHAMLFDFEKTDDQRNRMLLEQLVKAKTEIRKVKNSMSKQIGSLVDSVLKPEGVRAAALDEASYYKARYTALKSRDKASLSLLEVDRVTLLEGRLREAYAQKEKINLLLLDAQRHSQENQTARLLAEERASIAQNQSEVAQEAHQAALEKISKLYGHILKTESKCREDAIKIANLSNSLVAQLSLKDNYVDLADIHIKTVHLEATNIKCRNEVAGLLKQLEESQDEQESLEAMLIEKEHTYTEALLELEKIRIELDLVKRSTESKQTENSSR